MKLKKEILEMEQEKLFEATKKACEAVGVENVREAMESIEVSKGACHGILCKHCPGNYGYNGGCSCIFNEPSSPPLNAVERRKKQLEYAKRVLGILEEIKHADQVTEQKDEKIVVAYEINNDMVSLSLEILKVLRKNGEALSCEARKTAIQYALDSYYFER